MAHVIVGERLGRISPEMIGHIVKGAGHLIETATGWMQSGASGGHSIPNVANRSINTLTEAQAADQWQWAQLHTNYGSGSFAASSNGLPDYMKGLDFTLAGYEAPIDCCKGINFTMATADEMQWNRLKNNYGNGSLMAGNNNESSAAERAWKSSTEQALQRDLDFSEALDRVFDMENGAAKDAALSALSAFTGDPENAVNYGAAAFEGYTEAQIKKWKLIYDRALEKGISIPRPGGMQRMGTLLPGPDRDK